MSPNQRLMFAVALSVIFFVAYTAIFPPEQPEVASTDTKTEVGIKEDSQNTTQT